MGNFDLSFYLALLRRRLVLLAAIVFTVVAIGMLTILVLPVSYLATAKILIESPQIPAEMARSTVPTSPAEQFQIIREDVLSRENVVALARRFSVYGPAERMSPTDIVEDMEGRIHIDPVRMQDATGGSGATVLHIGFEAAKADVAANVANALVKMILDKDVELRTGRAQDTVQFFTQEADRLSAELKRIDGEILQFKNRNLDALPDSIDFRRSQWGALQQRLLVLAQEESTLRKRQTELGSGRLRLTAAPTTPEERALSDLRQALAQQLALFSESSPTIKVLRARIAALEAQATSSKPQESLEDQAFLSDRQLELGTIKDRLDDIADERAKIQETIASLSASIAITPTNETALNAMQRDRLNLQAQYDSAVARLAEASTGQQIELRLKGERLSLIEAAEPPPSPVNPKRKILLGGTLLAALFLAAAALVVPEVLNRKIRRPIELVNKMNIRPLITVPYISTSAKRVRHHRPRTAVRHQPMKLLSALHTGAANASSAKSPPPLVSAANSDRFGAST